MTAASPVARSARSFPSAPLSKPRLGVDMVPSSTWYENVRSRDPGGWQLLKRDCYRRAGNRCEVCGGKGPRWPVEAHERWVFVEPARLQVLAGLIALCPDCHEAVHFGRASIMGRDYEAEQHLARVNGWSRAQVKQHISDAVDRWDRLSEIGWRLDIGWAEHRLRELRAAPGASVHA